MKRGNKNVMCQVCMMRVDDCMCMLCDGFGKFGMSEKELKECEDLFKGDPMGMAQMMGVAEEGAEYRETEKDKKGKKKGKKEACEVMNVSEPGTKERCAHGNEVIERSGRKYVITLTIQDGDGKSHWCNCHRPAIKNLDMDGCVTFADGSLKNFMPTDRVLTMVSLPGSRETCGCKQLTYEGIDYHISSITDCYGVESKNVCRSPCQMGVRVDSFGHVTKMESGIPRWSVNNEIRTVVPASGKVSVQMGLSTVAKYGNSHPWSSDLFLRGTSDGDEKVNVSIRKSFEWCEHVPTELKIRFSELNGCSYTVVDGCELMSMRREFGQKHFEVDLYEGMWMSRKDLEVGCYMNVMARDNDDGSVELMVSEKSGKRGHPKHLRKFLDDIKNDWSVKAQLCENKSELVDGVMMFTNRYKFTVRCMHTVHGKYNCFPVLG